MAVSWNDQMLPRIREAAMRGVVAWIGDVEQRSVRKLTEGPWSGRIYRRRGVEHQASAPGEPAHSDTGRLLNSRRIEYLTDELRARLIYSTEYAAYLVLGTRKMEPRDFLRNSLEESSLTGHALVSAEIAAVLR